MPLPPDHIVARRAEARRRRLLRRRRRLALAGWSTVVALAAAAVVVALGGSPEHSHSAPSPVGVAARVHPAPPKLKAVRLAPRLVRLTAIGNRTIRALARLGKPLYCAGHRGHALAFTFDDGPGVYTHYAVRKLRQAHERATFFVVGKSLNAWPGWLARELPLAAIGDHTATHADLAVLSPAEVFAQINDARMQIEREAHRAVDLFRPPYGAIDSTVLQTARRLGLLTVMWTQDSQDSLGANYAGIIRNVESAMRPGAIILMHENRGQTIRALTTLLPELRRRHLRSVSLPELMATDPPSRRQFELGAAGCGAGPVRVSRGAS